MVGNSMGGFISAELAINFPQRVERLVLVSPAGLSTYGTPGGPRALAGCAGSGAGRRDGWLGRRPRRRVRPPAHMRGAVLGLIVRHPGRLPAALVAEQIRGGGKPGFLRRCRPTSTTTPPPPPPDRLPHPDRVGLPRPCYHRARRRRYAELIPNSRKVIFEDTGHVAELERPVEFNALLAEFLERVGDVGDGASRDLEPCRCGPATEPKKDEPGPAGPYMRP